MRGLFTGWIVGGLMGFLAQSFLSEPTTASQSTGLILASVWCAIAVILFVRVNHNDGRR